MKLSVIGAGSWGTALAQVAARNGHDVAMWARSGEVASGVNERHVNPRYLSDSALCERIWATTSVRDAIGGADGIIVATPSAYAREVARSLGDAGLEDDIALVICSKGVEERTGLVPTEVFSDVLGNPLRIAALSGPNHAEEVVKGVPAGTVVAGAHRTAELFQRLLGSASFRVYTSDDVLGVELCAAFKNVIAIAVGVSYGLGFGDNTAALLMTRGQAEMSRLVSAAGGRQLTCMGLAGTGDLIATCMSRHSRNRTFGEALVAGESLLAYEARRHMVVEGAQACRTLQTLSARHEVELPIADAVRALVWEGADPHTVVSALVDRSPKPEFY